MFLSNRKFSHTIIYTLAIGGSFYLGLIVFSLSAVRLKEIEIVSVNEFAPQLSNYNQERLVLNVEDRNIILKGMDVKKWIEAYTRDYTGKKDLRISWSQINEYLKSLAPLLNIEPTNAKFKFSNNRAEIFVPSTQGRKLDISQSANIIVSAIFNNQSSASLAFEMVEPEITLEKINDLGIKTLLGQGESDYGKSSAARIHNIKVGMSRFNGIILKPGEQFSFNENLGTVEEKDGYQSELVIKSGQLVREYGGGLCQVATTVFRAAVLSGLEVTERKPHSFPVQYYNPQGFDATIYPGVVDLKFVNNTENHVLIQTRMAGSKLMVEIYGSNNGEKVEMVGPVQYDKKSSGAMKAYFIRKIYKNGELDREERFDSAYKPPPPSPLERNPLE